MFRDRLVRLVSYLMRSAALPTDLSTRIQCCQNGVSGPHTINPISFVVPGSGIIMEGLAHALATANSSGPIGIKLPYATSDKNYPYTWVDWNDQATLATLLESDEPRTLVPVEIFERRGPARSNPRYRFGLFRSLEFLLTRRRAALLLGSPLIVGKAAEISLARLVRLLKVERSRSLRLVRGVPFQSQRSQEKQVLSGPEFERELGLVAQKQRISLAQARALSRREFHQISAAPVRWVFTFCAAIARWIIRQLFSEVSTIGLNQFVEAARDAAIVLVPMHRSHLDYILVGSVLYDSRVNTPVVAAGLNLSFWPVGPIIRSLGAYFVRRNARNDRIHSLVLKRYVSYLTKRGHLQEFFIEGGRSRSGRMRAPKLGLLSVMVDACAKGLRKELLFIPVSISYENVVEERALAEENTGIKKRSESLSDLFSLPRVFRRSYGEVVLQFGRPLSLSAMLSRVAATSTKLKPDTRTVVKELANALTTRLRSQSSISLSGLICTALLSAPRYGLSVKELEARLVLLARIARLARLQNPELGAFTRTLELFLERPEALRSVTQARSGLLKMHTVVDQEIVYIPGAKRFQADFYRNTCHHVFFPLAVIAAAERWNGTPLNAVIDLVHAVLEREYLLGTKEEFSQAVHAQCEIFIAEGLATRMPTPGPNIESLRLSEELVALGLDELLLVPLESMLWAAELLEVSVPEVSASETARTIPYKHFMTRAQAEFRPAAYRAQGSPSRTEAGSQSSLAGGLEMLESLNLIAIHEGVSGPSSIDLSKFNPSALEPYIALSNAIRVGFWSPSARAPRRFARSTMQRDTDD